MKPVGAGVQNLAEVLGKTLSQILLSYFNINTINIAN